MTNNCRCSEYQLEQVGCDCGHERATQTTEPWWIASDRERYEAMRQAIIAKPETALVRYQGDMRPETVRDVRAKMKALAARIEADIAQFRAVGGNYDRMTSAA